MKHRIINLIMFSILITVLSCQSIVDEDSSKSDQSSIDSIWLQDQIIASIEECKRKGLLNDNISYQYLVESKNNEANYKMIRIGIQMPARFQTDLWLYMDSAAKRFYYLDQINDSLVPIGLSL